MSHWGEDGEPKLEYLNGFKSSKKFNKKRFATLMFN